MQESVTRRVGWWGRLGAGSKMAANHHRRLRHYTLFPACKSLHFPRAAHHCHSTMAKGATAPSHNTSDTNDTSNTSDISDTVARELPARGREGDGGGGGGVGHLKADMHVRAKHENDGVWRFCPSISGSRRCTSTFMTGSKCGERHERLAWKQHLRASSNRQGAASFLLSVADE